MYGRKFFEKQRLWRGDYLLLAIWMEQNLEGYIFGDIGCGEGYLIEDLHLRFGKSVWGVDGSRAFKRFASPHLKRALWRKDLCQPQKLPMADVAVCMEVAEHLPEDKADVLIGSILSTGAKTIVFTAAHPGQDGTNHINLQPQKYWIAKFTARGYRLDKRLTDKFKKDLTPQLRYTPWYAQNIMIYSKI